MGVALSQITRHFCQALGVKARILPMSDDPVSTWVLTDEGNLPFQEYFVHRQCQPRVSGFQFAGIERARPAPGVLEAIQQSDLIVFCPSNPWVSIDPILSVLGIRQAISSRNEQSSLAVSPIIGGQAVKGPAAKMFTELGLQPSAREVARHYGRLLDGFVLDQVDAGQEPDIQALGLQTLLTDTIMRTNQDRVRLAKEVIAFGFANQKG
jgi:LPPG:FO 2-phospho-L-lactate transferase